MEEISLTIRSANSTKTPLKWQQPYDVNIQRFYYIKGGSGYMVHDDGVNELFQKGCIYIFPHNLKQNFVADPDDPMDHIFFDFFSTPPIIAPQPLVYPVKEDTAAAEAIRFVDRLLREFRQMNETGSGDWEEQKRIQRAVLEMMLRLLSAERPIPFSKDQAVSRALVIIHERYRTSLSVEALATEAGFTPNAFLRHFKRVMGQTPYAYIKDYRLIKATELISQGVTVARAAELVGYENGSSLSRALAGKRPEKM